jgi:hypothetical protein
MIAVLALRASRRDHPADLAVQYLGLCQSLFCLLDGVIGVGVSGFRRAR